MHAFKRESTDYTFELNDKNLTISCNDYLTGNMTRFDSDDYVEYGRNKGMPYILVIKDFMEKIKSPEAGTVVQNVLSAFFHTFEKQGDHREQLRKGLRYFSLADHYGVLAAALPSEVLEGARLKYDQLLSDVDSQVNEYAITEQMIQKFHINEPMVATTGLVVYATLNDNWYIFETNERHKDIPEYLHSVLHHTDFKRVTSVTSMFTGTQNECQQYVLNKQKDVYGVSLSEFKNLATKIDFTKKLIDDMEILLNVPYDQTYAGKIELAEREQALNNVVGLNIHHLNLINRDDGDQNAKQ